MRSIRARSIRALGLLAVLLLAAALAPTWLRAQAPVRAGRTGDSAAGSPSDWRTATKSNAAKADSAPRQPVVPPESDEGRIDEDTKDRRESASEPPSDRARHNPETRVRGFSDAAFINADQVWREYGLTPYTARLASVARPEQSVVDWVLRRTGPETWNGEDVAVLSATRSRLRVFHRPDVQTQVAEIVDRFTRPVQSQASLRVQIVTCTDLDWRSGLAHLLKPVALGPDGQQAWVIPQEDASLLRGRLRRDSQVVTLAQQQIVANNGQPATIETTRVVNYISGMELESGLQVAYQPAVARLNEGVKLTLEPLWTTDGSGVDVTVRLATRVVSRLHNARSVAPLSTGNQNAVVQVPEVAATWFEETIAWPHSQVLLVSGGVQAGTAATKRGTFGFSSAPNELLILAELDAPLAVRTSSRRPAARE